MKCFRSADADASYAGSSPHLNGQQQASSSSHLERRESSRLQAAKQLILRSLRPGHTGWAEVSSSSSSSANNSSSPGASAEPSKANATTTGSQPSLLLDRNNQLYHSEGKGLKAKRKAWASSTALSNSATKPSSEGANKKSKEDAKKGARNPSVRRRLSLGDGDDMSAVSTAPAGLDEEVVYENLPSLRRAVSTAVSSNPCDQTIYSDSNYVDLNQASAALPSMLTLSRGSIKDGAAGTGRERRSFRKLTKDSGYETSNYSDYANLDSLGRIVAAEGGEEGGEACVTGAGAIYEVPGEVSPRSRSPNR